ncbi:hypothetical protein PR202_gb04865 [Eleusine coracana subsp. coracana]|uniref:Transcription repressor n=1 Tax=Eleusine coracana subsp. coracana TaxID=191504 RepID=A0AAV5E579_ELECO|nr:hypothetical protein PR202_gb04865 [Eleusine coracana subsp. coracana]
MHLREAMETASASSGTGTGGRKKLKHRLAAILSAFSRRGGGRKRRDSQEEAEKTPPPPLGVPVLLPPRQRHRQEASRRGNWSSNRAGSPCPRRGPRRCSTSPSTARAAAPSTPPTRPSSRSRSRRSTRTPMVNRKAGGGGEWEGRKCPPSSPFVAAHLPPLPPGEDPNGGEQLVLGRRGGLEEEPLLVAELLLRLVRLLQLPPLPHQHHHHHTRARASISGPCRAPPQSTSRRGASQSCRYSFELPRGSTASDGGFAVVKRSADPYEDFRKSMHEMIAEWPAEEDGAERLLETYLVLNSPRHYPAILAAFADVRETLFP